jgi:hypothetical protein
MNANEMISSTPIQVEKSARSDEIRAITSMRGGYIVPLAFFPILREDAVTRGEVRVSFEMLETLHPLLNAVNAKVMAHFVSPLAYDRFASGMDSFNRSYQGVAEPAPVGTVIPFYQTMPFAKAAAVWAKLGVQWKEGGAVNQAPVEAYNAIVNFRRRARTDKLPVRTALDTTLAEAFWKNSSFSDIVPDWDQAAIEGEVPLSFLSSKVNVKGLGLGGVAQTAGSNNNVRTTGGTVSGTAWSSWVVNPAASAAGQAVMYVKNDTVNSGGYPDIWADLSEAGVTVSLANIELAKQTAAFAKLSERFDGIEDDHIIDLLMEGIRVPDEAMKQPLLLDSKSTIFGMSERHAMDGDNLDLSRTTGQTGVNVRFRLPPMNTGGLVMITAEIVPEQLYERALDPFLSLGDPAFLPNFMRDFLDPEKVEVVHNQYVDVHHGTPSAVFGYAPLNFKWRRNFARAGGKFYRPNPDVFVEDRQRFWSADQTNPTLADDFYMVSDLPHTVFADTVGDPFEVVTIGRLQIVGNTVFGDRLTEDTGSYDEVMSQIDMTRITQVAIPGATEAEVVEDE